MTVPVIFLNGNPGIVSTSELDTLLNKNKLLAFHRSDGWVKVGIDDMRDPDGRRGLSWKDRKSLSRQSLDKSAK